MSSDEKKASALPKSGKSLSNILCYQWQLNPSEPESEIDKTATAILRKKNKPNSLIVDDAVNDDNSIIAMSNNTMETLNLFRGDNVIVKGKKRRDTILVALVCLRAGVTFLLTCAGG